MYGHAERVRLATQIAIAETVELLLRLPSLNDEQLQFVREFAPELRLQNRARPASVGCADTTDRDGCPGKTTPTVARRSA
jgi:hypothetical protein